jgi:hypothetical protein
MKLFTGPVKMIGGRYLERDMIWKLEKMQMFKEIMLGAA